MKLNIDHTMRFLESDIPVSLDSSVFTLMLFIGTMSMIFGNIIYRWNLNHDWHQLGLLGSYIGRYD